MISAEEIKALMAKDAYRTKGEWVFTKIENRTRFRATYSLKAGDVLLSNDECYYPTGLDSKDAEFVAALASKAIPAILTLQTLLNQAAEAITEVKAIGDDKKMDSDRKLFCIGTVLAPLYAAIQPYLTKEGE